MFIDYVYMEVKDCLVSIGVIVDYCVEIVQIFLFGYVGSNQ